MGLKTVFAPRARVGGRGCVPVCMGVGHTWQTKGKMLRGCLRIVCILLDI
jgi:hypothetical protein